MATSESAFRSVNWKFSLLTIALVTSGVRGTRSSVCCVAASENMSLQCEELIDACRPAISSEADILEVEEDVTIAHGSGLRFHEEVASQRPHLVGIVVLDDLSGHHGKANVAIII